MGANPVGDVPQVGWADPHGQFYGLAWVTPEMGDTHIYVPVYECGQCQGSGRIHDESTREDGGYGLAMCPTCEGSGKTQHGGSDG